MRLLPTLVLAVVLAGQGEFSTGAVVTSIASTGATIASIIASIVNVAKMIKSGGDHKELLRNFENVTKINQFLEHLHTTSLEQLRSIEESLGSQISWGHTVDDLEDLLRPIHSKYDRFLFYQRDRASIENYTLVDFAREAVSHSPDSLHSTMYSLRDLVLGSRRGSATTRRHKRYAFKAGLFRKLKSVLQQSEKVICGLKTSPQQQAFVLYGILANALVTNFSMVQFSYMLLRLFGKGSFDAEEENFYIDSKNISLAVAQEADLAMRDLSPDFWRCDPAQHQRGVTYEEVTKLVQGYIENEKDISSTGSCWGHCYDYKSDRPPQGRCLKYASWNPLCESQRRCKGTLYACHQISEETDVCLANSTTHRQYNWIKYPSGVTQGRDDGLHKSCAATYKLQSVNNDDVKCSWCFCICDDSTDSHRYFSLKPAVSDVSKSKIVTGVRFKQKSGIFYIQLEQGVADPIGYVKPSTVEWKPINYNNNKRDHLFKDVLTLSYKKRTVILQSLEAPPGYVVTGVSFLDYEWENILSVAIQVTAISQEGVLDPDSSRWVTRTHRRASPDRITRMDLPWNLIPSMMLGTPGLEKTPSWPDSPSLLRLQLVPSSKEKDLAQTTLPLLDIQTVAPRPAVWLTGIGLYYKGQNGGGGFIGLNVKQGLI